VIWVTDKVTGTVPDKVTGTAWQAWAWC